MRFTKKNCVFALNLCAASFIMLFSFSCSAIVKDSRQPFNNKLMAESSMMKKRLPLIERECAVLEKENQLHKIKIQELEARNAQLDEVLASQKETYANDMAAGEAQISSLQETIQQQELENSRKVEELIARNKDLEEKMMKENLALHEQITKQKKAFAQEREQMMQDGAKKELALTTEVDHLEQQLAPKEREIASLKLAINEISIQLGAATTLSETLKKSRDESLAEIASVKAANLKAREKLLAELESVKAANKKAGAESMAELESVKAANADLNKKVAELSYRLASKNNPTATNN